MIQKERTTDALFEEAVFKAKQAGLVKTGDTVVITAGVPLGVVGKSVMIHVVEVEYRIVLSIYHKKVCKCHENKTTEMREYGKNSISHGEKFLRKRHHI